MGVDRAETGGVLTEQRTGWVFTEQGLDGC